MIIYCNIILLTDNKLSNGSALLREKVFFLVVLVYNWSNIFFFDAVWNFFRLVISFSIFQRKYGGRKEGKSCRVGRMNVNDELSFAFHSKDQFQLSHCSLDVIEWLRVTRNHCYFARSSYQRYFRLDGCKISFAKCWF